jgi:hypothetical protein
MVPFERGIKLRIAQRSDADCYVIGSSQVTQIDRETMPLLAANCSRVANLATSGSTFEDLVAAAARVAANPHARKIFIGVEPWAFRLMADRRWMQEKEAYLEGRRLFNLPKVTLPSLDTFHTTQLLNAVYLRRNIEVLWRRGLHALRYPEIKSVGPHGERSQDDEAIYLPNGRLVYSRLFLATNGNLPIESVGDGSYKIADPEIDSAVTTEWGLLIKELNTRGISVEFILSPYHPKVFECRNVAVCRALETVEPMIRTLASQNGVAVIGSYRPEPFEFGPADYFDDLHLKQAALSRLRVLNWSIK